MASSAGGRQPLALRQRLPGNPPTGLAYDEPLQVDAHRLGALAQLAAIESVQLSQIGHGRPKAGQHGRAVIVAQVLAQRINVDGGQSRPPRKIEPSFYGASIPPIAARSS